MEANPPIKIINKITEQISRILASAGSTAKEFEETLFQFQEYLKKYNGNAPLRDYETVLAKERYESEVRPVMNEKTENPNQKSDLEISQLKDEDKPIYIFKNGAGIFTVDNSQWNMDLLLDPFRITYDDDWIKEILEET